jgi:hypothetical protein
MSVKKSLVRNFIRYPVVFVRYRFSLFALLAQPSRGVVGENSLKKVEIIFHSLGFLVKTARFVRALNGLLHSSKRVIAIGVGAPGEGV